MSYYKIVDGKKMDSRLLEMAEKSIQGGGNGRISKADAEEIIQAVKDGGDYTEVEKDTMEYIRDNFTWTDNANDWFRNQISSWAGTK